MPDQIFPHGRGTLLFLALLAHTLFIPAASWLGALCAGLSIPVLCIIFLAICKKTGTTSIWDSLHRAPKWPRRVLALLLMVSAAWFAFRTAQNSASFLIETALVKWPLWLGVIALLVLGWLIAHQGAPAVFLWAIPMAWLAGFIILLSLVLSMPDWQVNKSMLTGAFSLGDVFRQFLAVLPATIALLLFSGHDDALPQGKALVFGGLCAALLTGLTVFRASAVLGANCARAISYPSYAAAGVFELGTLARSEVIFGMAFAVCMTARIALFCAVVRTGWQLMRGKS